MNLNNNTAFVFVCIGVFVLVMILGLGFKSCTKKTDTEYFDYNKSRVERKVEKVKEKNPYKNSQTREKEVGKKSQNERSKHQLSDNSILKKLSTITSDPEIRKELENIAREIGSLQQAVKEGLKEGREKEKTND